MLLPTAALKDCIVLIDLVIAPVSGKNGLWSKRARSVPNEVSPQTSQAERPIFAVHGIFWQPRRLSRAQPFSIFSYPNAGTFETILAPKSTRFPFLSDQELEDDTPPGSSSHPTPSILLLVRLTGQPLSRSRSQKTPFPTTFKILRYIVYKCLTPCQEIPRHVDDLTSIYESKTKPRGCWQRRLSFSGSRVFIFCPDSEF